MNVQMIQMDPRIAKIHKQDYHKKILEHRAERRKAAKKQIQEGGKVFRAGRQQRSQLEKEDEILFASYRALAGGQKIINVGDAIMKAGLDTKTKLPLLAIARADWQKAILKNEDQDITFSDKDWDRFSRSKRTYQDGVVWFPQHLFPAELTNKTWRASNGLPVVDNQKALVPAIPAHLRPAGDLSKYHILWEAEWKHEAPLGTILLQHIAGPMYSVLAQWDLTPIEQQVLVGR